MQPASFSCDRRRSVTFDGTQQQEIIDQKRPHCQKSGLNQKEDHIPKWTRSDLKIFSLLYTTYCVAPSHLGPK
ncbi:hypothetical protein EXN66_Car021279 [Channa argus]|uniref:Uncharacterized protein n=1 Tax=Channa argus TaxID=215402 RepID=A0A6G1QTP5_CHAAH|nr:hypothetical protein EXN66_Car021279 [Channa argus]